jgi:hypothetical protein
MIGDMVSGPRQTPGGIVTLTTDFGTRDGYAGAVKGVVLARDRSIAVVDVTHDVPPGDVRAGAWCVRVSAPLFPPGTVHVVVVDPGVGTSRRAVILACGGQTYVAPDNGVLGLLEAPVTGCWSIPTPGRASRTFHGRDVFAPAAAALAAGESPERLGEEVDARTLAPPPVDTSHRLRPGEAVGRVVHVDRFGNLVTSLPESLAARASRFGGSVAGRRVTAPVSSYEAIADGRAAFIPGSQGLLEVSVRGASAAELLGAAPGGEAILTLDDEAEP